MDLPYGSWVSPITAQNAAAGTLRFSEVKLSQGKVYWLERRSTEGGRTALMCWDNGTMLEVLPKECNVRTRVHEYGGGALLVDKEKIYFIDDRDQQVHSFSNGKVESVTSVKNARFADGCAAGNALYYVMEEHGAKVLNSIVKIENGHVDKVASGHDFYSAPRVSPNGQELAYVRWDNPNLPWDGTELWVLNLKTKEERKVAGGWEESIANPIWAPDGKLYYVSDRSNWWNLYREGSQAPVWSMEAEFSLPQWVFGRELYGFSREGIVTAFVKNAMASFARWSGSEWLMLNLPFTTTDGVAIEGGKMAAICGSPERPDAVVVCDLAAKELKTVRSARAEQIDPGYISIPKAIEFPSAGRVAHAFYYPPTNPNYKGMPGEKPPLIVHSHGGPTGHVWPSMKIDFLYWTSRGYAVVDVNYGGSTGYGRAYRDLLKKNWGIVDVDDCTNAALYCAEKGLADRNRLCIEGGSAGGYTTLACLAFRDVFRAGADLFGVSDIERLALDTHKFEAEYMVQLVGPYPEMKELYHQRSPLYSVDKIKSPVIILQGDEDAIVPPSQSEMVYNSLLKRKVPTAYLLFKGEQHGFRKAENIQRTLEAQLYFFSKVLGIPLSEKIEPVKIENL